MCRGDDAQERTVYVYISVYNGSSLCASSPLHTVAKYRDPKLIAGESGGGGGEPRFPHPA